MLNKKKKFIKLNKQKTLGNSSTKYVGVIFDFNGVLLWDSLIQEKAWQNFSMLFRGSLLSSEEVSHVIHGRTNSFILNYLNEGNFLNKKQVKELSEKKEKIYRDLCLSMKSNFQLSPGSEEFLNFCKENGIPCAIATASPKVNLDFFVKHLQLNRWFNSSVMVYDDGSFPGKPAPDIYLLASGKLNLRPQDCIVIEDSISGLKSAITAGIGKIYAMNSTESDIELRKTEGVSDVINQVNEIPRNIFWGL